MKTSVVLTSFRGRIPRSTWWRCTLAVATAFVVLFVFLEAVAGRNSTLALYPFLFWTGAALAIKRLHDGGGSAWRLLAVLIPVLGPLWLVYQLAFRRGTPGENHYGDDPLTLNTDYLTVR